MGNAMGGGMGGEVEVYLFDDPLSLFEGLGHLFEDDDGGPGGPGNALGTRLFFGGVQDHVFLELSWNTLTFGYPRGTDLITGVNRRYGPAFQFGFQHAGLDGFSFMISGGVGYLPGSVPRYADRWPPRFTFGVGYTKR
jgi:hypothetical protein